MSNKVIKQKIDYIRDNHVEAGLVYKAEDYVDEVNRIEEYIGKNEVKPYFIE